MAVVKITIDATNDQLTVNPNVANLKVGDTAQWDITNLNPGRRVDVEFDTQGGICGPFVHGGGSNAQNPTRGWYGTHHGQPLSLGSNAGDQSKGTMWKYDVA